VHKTASNSGAGLSVCNLAKRVESTANHTFSRVPFGCGKPDSVATKARLLSPLTSLVPNRILLPHLLLRPAQTSSTHPRTTVRSKIACVDHIHEKDRIDRMRGWSHAPSLHSTGGASTVRVDEVAMACHRALLEANEFARIRTVPVLDGVLPSSEGSSAVWRDRLFDAPSRSVDGLRRCRSFVRCFVACCIATFPTRFGRFRSRRSPLDLPVHVCDRLDWLRSWRRIEAVETVAHAQVDTFGPLCVSVPGLWDGRDGGDSYSGRFSCIRFSSGRSDLDKCAFDGFDRRWGAKMTGNVSVSRSKISMNPRRIPVSWAGNRPWGLFYSTDPSTRTVMEGPPILVDLRTSAPPDPT